MQLHYAPNTISIAVAIALEEVGATYEAVKVDFASGAQSKPAYLAVNPKGRVPTLVTKDGILTETGGLLEFVAPDLVPNDPFQAAKMREVTYYLAATMHINHAHKMRGHRWADHADSHADMTAKVPETMAASCAYLEDSLAFDPFVLGQELSIADIYLFVISNWLPGDGVDLADYPKLNAFQQMMNTRPSVRTVRSKGMLG